MSTTVTPPSTNSQDDGFNTFAAGVADHVVNDMGLHRKDLVDAAHKVGDVVHHAVDALHGHRPHLHAPKPAAPASHGR